MDYNGYGYFPKNEKASFVIKDTLRQVNAEYIYQNKEVLIKVDKYGPIYMQTYPPKDIMIFKRESQERFSKWQVFISCPQLGVERVSAFGFPRTIAPRDEYIKFSPEKAEYFYDYGKFSVKTVISVPKEGCFAMLSVSVKNANDEDLSFGITTAMYPYVNKAALAPWDKTEWYLRTCAVKRENRVEFVTKLSSPVGNADERRLVTTVTSGTPSVEIDMDKYVGNGSFDMPSDLGKLSMNYESLGSRSFEDCSSMVWYPSVHAAHYDYKVVAGGECDITQIICMQSPEFKAVYNFAEAECTAEYLSKTRMEESIAEVKAFYDEYFSRRSVKTENPAFDEYVNGFLPLQMHWVASLDRGWPTGMRGVRDASQDFTGVLYYNPEQARDIILLLFGCQRKDGWLPRQVSASGRFGKHDLRPYVDGGAFLIELLYYYLAFTGDYSLLDEKSQWLDSDEYSSLYIHAVTAMNYYIDEENIGEHGLCKVRGGDWLDTLDNAGNDGRGETVMVTGQAVIDLEYMSEICVLYANDEQLRDRYLAQAKVFRNNLNKHAFNDKGYYNAVFNDCGQWIFSDKDPDGEERMYGPANYFAVVSGAADEQKQNSILENVRKRLKAEEGYKLFWPAMGEQPLKKVGRIASGEFVVGSAENGSNYNHGSQGFLARMLGYVKRGDLLEETIDYILPYDNEKHPVEQTKTAPYSIVNCYLSAPLLFHRGGMSFLTGSISMAVRAVYTYMFGIDPTLKGLKIAPCFRKGNINRSTNFVFRNCNFEIKYKGENVSGKFNIKINGDIYENGKGVNEFILDYDELKNYNYIEIEFIG